MRTNTRDTFQSSKIQSARIKETLDRKDPTGTTKARSKTPGFNLTSYRTRRDWRSVAKLLHCGNEVSRMRTTSNDRNMPAKNWNKKCHYFLDGYPHQSFFVGVETGRRWGDYVRCFLFYALITIDCWVGFWSLWQSGKHWDYEFSSYYLPILTCFDPIYRFSPFFSG